MQSVFLTRGLYSNVPAQTLEREVFLASISGIGSGEVRSVQSSGSGPSLSIKLERAGIFLDSSLSNHNALYKKEKKPHFPITRFIYPYHLIRTRLRLWLLDRAYDVPSMKLFKIFNMVFGFSSHKWMAKPC